MANKLKLTITGGADQGTTVELDLFTSLLVGRSRKSDVRLHDADVSGRHFEFVRGTAGVCVKDLSRNGLKVDGKVVGEGEIVPVRPGSVVEVGVETKLTVDELPGDGQEEGAAASAAADGEGQTSAAEDFFSSEAERTESVASGVDSVVQTASVVHEEEAPGETATRGDFEDALTEAADGETQEMKTRVGSMEEIYARKRQLDRASIVRRWKFSLAIVGVLLALAAVWIATGSRHHVSDAEDPKLEDGSTDTAVWWVCDDAGDPELMIEFPRCERMKVTPSDGSNTVDIVSFLGTDGDIPFHLVLNRWRDLDGVQYSLEDSFLRRIQKDAQSGVSFEGRRQEAVHGEFFDNVFPGFCEWPSPRGVRFVRMEFTRSIKAEFWHGVVLYLRNGDMNYELRTEIPDIYWKRAGHRLTDEPHLGVYRRFAEKHWDSPGRSGLVSDAFSDDYLLMSIKKELMTDRASSWSVVESYLNTILVRSWGVKPHIQKKALAYYLTFLEKLQRFYSERQLAFDTAKANGDDKRMKEIFYDVQTAFGVMPCDRRSTLVRDPEVWSCH